MVYRVCFSSPLFLRLSTDVNVVSHWLKAVRSPFLIGTMKKLIMKI